MALGLGPWVEKQMSSLEHASTRAAEMTSASLNAAVIVDIFLDGTVPCEIVVTALEKMDVYVTGSLPNFKMGLISAEVTAQQAWAISQMEGILSIALWETNSGTSSDVASHDQSLARQASQKPTTRGFHNNGSRDAGQTRLIARNAGQPLPKHIWLDTMNARTLSSRFNGEGVNVAVMSTAYNTYGGERQDILNGYLPGTGNPYGYTKPVIVISDARNNNDEGRAMLQHVHVMAPRAQLCFDRGTGTAGTANSILRLPQPPCNADIIVDDLIYNASPYEDGAIAQAIETVISRNNVLFLTAAGNGGRQAITLNANFVPNTDRRLPVVLRSIAGVPEWQFSGASFFFRFTTYFPGRANLIMWWNQASGPETAGGFKIWDNLDLYIFDPAYNLLAFSNEDNFRTFIPSETASFSGSSASFFYLAVGRRAKRAPFVPTPPLIIYIYGMFGADSDGPAVVGHSGTRTVIAVGAFDYTDTSTPALITSPGPTLRFWSWNQQLLNVNGTIRFKPDVGAIHCTPNSFFPFGVDADFYGTGWQDFCGTSAAAPNLAGVVALLRQARPSLNQFELKDVLRATAVRQRDGQWDRRAGYGLVDADRAYFNLTGANGGGARTPRPSPTGLRRPPTQRPQTPSRLIRTPSKIVIRTPTKRVIRTATKRPATPTRRPATPRGPTPPPSVFTISQLDYDRRTQPLPLRARCSTFFQEIFAVSYVSTQSSCTADARVALSYLRRTYIGRKSIWLWVGWQPLGYASATCQRETMRLTFSYTCAPASLVNGVAPLGVDAGSVSQTIPPSGSSSSSSSTSSFTPLTIGLLGVASVVGGVLSVMITGLVIQLRRARRTAAAVDEPAIEKREPRVKKEEVLPPVANHTIPPPDYRVAWL